MELAAIIARNAPLGIQGTKEAAAKYVEQGEAAAIACIPSIRKRVLTSADAREGIQVFCRAACRRVSGTVTWLIAGLPEQIASPKSCGRGSIGRAALNLASGVQNTQVI